MDDKPQILETKIRIYFKFLALYFQRKGCVWGRPKTYPDPKDMGLWIKIVIARKVASYFFKQEDRFL